MAKIQRRQTVELSSYPDLVVIYLGMQAKSLRGLKTLLSYGPRITRAANAEPDGLLRHQFLLFGLFPPHLGMRQYWRDFDALERWARSEPHRRWWQALLRDAGGTSFWHETYFIRVSSEAAWSRSFSTWTRRPGCCRSPRPMRPGARCSRPGAGCGCRGRSWPRPGSPRRSSTRPAELSLPGWMSRGFRQ
jgi:Domain of unknown function (DUF4188)